MKFNNIKYGDDTAMKGELLMKEHRIVFDSNSRLSYLEPPIYRAFAILVSTSQSDLPIAKLHEAHSSYKLRSKIVRLLGNPKVFPQTEKYFVSCLFNLIPRKSSSLSVRKAVCSH